MRILILTCVCAGVIAAAVDRSAESTCNKERMKDDPICRELLYLIERKKSLLQLFEDLVSLTQPGSLPLAVLGPDEGLLGHAYISQYLAATPDKKSEYLIMLRGLAGRATRGFLNEVFSRFAGLEIDPEIERKQRDIFTKYLANIEEELAQITLEQDAIKAQYSADKEEWLELNVKAAEHERRFQDIRHRLEKFRNSYGTPGYMVGVQLRPQITQLAMRILEADTPDAVLEARTAFNQYIGNLILRHQWSPLAIWVAAETAYETIINPTALCDAGTLVCRRLAANERLIDRHERRIIALRQERDELRLL